MTITGETMPSVIRIVCTSKTGHPARRPEVTVTTFRHIGDDVPGDQMTGRWTEDNRSPRLRSTGRTLAGDELYSSTSEQDGPVRSNYLLECPKHPERGHIDLTEEKMFRVLNLFRLNGQNVLSLVALGAMLERMEQSSS